MANDDALAMAAGVRAGPGQDIALHWKEDRRWWGIKPGPDGDIAGDRDLVTLVLMMSFLSARAGQQDRLPDDQTDPRGWVGAHSLPDGVEDLGCRLWLFGRAIVSEPWLPGEAAHRLQAALEVIRTPLGLASRIEVDGQRDGLNGLKLHARIYRAEAGYPERRFRTPWGQITVYP